MSKFRALLVSLASSVVLCACGGGGGGDSYASTGSKVAISPATVSIDVGQSLVMRITGGLGPYRLVSSSPQVLPVPGVIDNLHAADLTLTTGDAFETQTVTVTVIDNNGQSAKADVTVKAVAMAMSPSSISLAATQSQVFHLFGGRPPFVVTSSRPDILVLDTSQLATTKVFTVVASDVSVQIDNISLSVLDAVGTTVSAKVSVMPLQVFSSIQVNPSGSASAGTVDAIAAGQHGVVAVQVTDSYSVPRTITAQRLNGEFTLDGADANESIQIDVGSDRSALATITVPASAVTQTGKLRITDNTTGKFIDHSFQISGLALSTSPAALAISSLTSSCLSGPAGVLQIMGGVPPYAISSTAPTTVSGDLSSVAQSGGSTLLTAYGICTDATGVTLLTVTDAVGAKTLVPFTSRATVTATVTP